MADYITRILTKEGEKQIDYNALANLPNTEWRYLGEINYEPEDSASTEVTLSVDEDGNPFECEEVYVQVTAQTLEVSYALIRVNGKSVGEARWGTNQWCQVFVFKHGEGWYTGFMYGNGTQATTSFNNCGTFLHNAKFSHVGHKIKSIGFGPVKKFKAKVWGR